MTLAEFSAAQLVHVLAKRFHAGEKLREVVLTQLVSACALYVSTSPLTSLAPCSGPAQDSRLVSSLSESELAL
eukprot:427045-Hanusia_phi.AAC.6